MNLSVTFNMGAPVMPLIRKLLSVSRIKNPPMSDYSVTDQAFSTIDDMGAKGSKIESREGVTVMKKFSSDTRQLLTAVSSGAFSRHYRDSQDATQCTARHATIWAQGGGLSIPANQPVITHADHLFT